MSEPQYSLAEVAKIIGKSEKTISRWIKSGKIPAIRHGTGYLISEQDIPLKLDLGVDRHTLIQQRLLEPGLQTESTGMSHGSGRVDIHNLIDVATLITGGQADRKNSFEHISQMLQKHHSDVEHIIREQNELAEKYARATYKIGQMEERNRLLEEHNLKLEQKMSLLPPPEQWQSARQELTQLKEDLRHSESDYRARLQSTEANYEQKIRLLQEQILQSEAIKKDLQTQKERLEQAHQEAQTELLSERKKGFWQRLFKS